MNVPGPVAVADTERHAEQILAFRLHAAVFAATMVLIVLVNLLTNLRAGIAGDLSAWWSIWALIGWSLGVGIHGLVVRLAQPASGERAP